MMISHRQKHIDYINENRDKYSDRKYHLMMLMFEYLDSESYKKMFKQPLGDIRTSDNKTVGSFLKDSNGNELQINRYLKIEEDYLGDFYDIGKYEGYIIRLKREYDDFEEKVNKIIEKYDSETGEGERFHLTNTLGRVVY